MRTLAALVFAFLLAGALAGCIGGSSSDAAVPSNDSPDIVTDPSNYTYVDNASFATGGHVHDYWGGQDRLVVMDRTEVVNGLYLSSNLTFPFRPAGGHVIPQGTAEVEVTVDWETSAASHHLPPELWIKTAADDEPWELAELERGRTYTIASTNDENDLPHQQLSAWTFQFRVPNPNEPVQYEPLIFNGTVSIRVEAVRGLELPVFPAHPEPWDGRSELGILGTNETRAFTGFGSCITGCEDMVHEPGNGSIVPHDAAMVRAVMTSLSPVPNPSRFGLAYHGADTRNFTRLDPNRRDGDRWIYEVPVTPEQADGPYALQSQWRFRPYIDEPVEDGMAWNQYNLTVTVHRSMAAG